MDKSGIKGKRRARKLALQALYQWLMAQADPSEIEAQFRSENDMSKVDVDYFCRLLHGVTDHLDELEGAFVPLLDRSIQELNPVELSVLRLSTFELLHCPELPYRVVLDEAINLTKLFGTQEGYKYVNGVLNNLAKTVRAVEIEAGHG